MVCQWNSGGLSLSRSRSLWLFCSLSLSLSCSLYECVQTCACAYLKKQNREEKSADVPRFAYLSATWKKESKTTMPFLLSWVPMSSSSVQFNWPLSGNKWSSTRPAMMMMIDDKLDLFLDSTRGEREKTRKSRTVDQTSSKTWFILSFSLTGDVGQSRNIEVNQQRRELIVQW